MKRWQRERRELLGKLGVGAACLPLLHTSRSWGAGVPKRLLLIQMTQGLRQAAWRPATGPLATQTLPATSAAFEAWKSQMIFLPNLSNPGAGTEGRGAYGVMFYGLGATGTGEYKEPAGKTLDQVVAGGLPAPPSGRASLNLAVQLDRPPRASDALGANRCFWAGAGRPIAPIGDPYVVYQQLFAGPPDLPDPATIRRLIARRRSILDSVGANLQDFGRRLGTNDRLVIEAHLQAIRELERRLQPGPPGDKCGPPPVPKFDLQEDAIYAKVLDAQLDMIIAAFKCGVTQVATLQTSDSGGSNVKVGAFVPGLPTTRPLQSWEDVAQTPLSSSVDPVRLVERWFFDRFAGLLGKLAATPEGAGSLLDNTVVVIANHMQDGVTQDAQKVPWMIAGKGGGYFATGACLPSDGRSIASVMAGVCEAMGVAPHPYGAVMPGLRRV